MAAIDYGTLIIKDGKVLNKEDELFPRLVIGDYTLDFYKRTLHIYKNNNLEQSVEDYYYFGYGVNGVGKCFSHHLNTVAGRIDIRTLSRKNRDRFIARVGGYIIIFGYGIDNSLNRGYQAQVMRDYGFDKREKRIVSKYLWGERKCQG